MFAVTFIKSDPPVYVPDKSAAVSLFRQDITGFFVTSRSGALYASVRNLANEPRQLVTISANAPAYTQPRTYTYYGALWTLGVKGTF